ncbi:hypothetical protein [Chryseobacterium sp. Mn2064]|uniref:hypothetical protein n=1 Tax=Chryseobacterium sp. Mn2064 TaxID=3395263 RepID=UPI003BEAF0BD
MNDNNIFGCFVSVTLPYPNEKQETQDLGKRQGDLFRSYIFGEKGISKIIKTLENNNYGNDFKIILFQFYVNPLPIEQQNLKEIESYRKNEKSIGIPIIINDDNFFSKSERERYTFLSETLVGKMDLLLEVIKKKKLDTNLEKLKLDLQKILNQNDK